MRLITIGTTDIILQNYKKGQGKIIIADPYRGSFSYYWGAMGPGSIELFLKDINPEYFAGCLCDKNIVFSAKATAKNLRRYIKKELKEELPWYKFPTAQKELREKIKEIESLGNDYEAVDFIGSLHETINCWELNHHEEKEFLDIIKSHFASEPWHYLGEENSPEYNFLYNLHSELKTNL